jgi:hypothetical protein
MRHKLSAKKHTLCLGLRLPRGCDRDQLRGLRAYAQIPIASDHLPAQYFGKGQGNDPGALHPDQRHSSDVLRTTAPDNFVSYQFNWLCLHRVAGLRPCPRSQAAQHKAWSTPECQMRRTDGGFPPSPDDNSALQSWVLPATIFLTPICSSVNGNSTRIGSVNMFISRPNHSFFSY